MNLKLKYPVLTLLVAGTITSCTKMKDIGILNTGSYSDTSATLKSVANDMNIGFAAYQGDAGFSQYFPIIAREANILTPGNEMKYGSIVQNDGTFIFTKADALYNQATSSGLSVYGHTLLWHQQQNATYLNTITGGGSSNTVPNLISTNAGFEAGSTGWSIFNTNGATVTFVTGDAANAHAGNGYMKVVNPTAQTGNQWKVQVSSAAFTTTPGKQYTISYWVKAASSGGSIRLSTGPSAAQYQGDQTIGTSWQQVSWTITASLPSTTFLFDMGQAANTYYIDDASVIDVAAANEAAANSSAGAVAERLDSVMKLWIVGTAAAPGIVTHYAGKIPAWDVANEVLADNGTLRTSSNTTIPNGATGYFFWGDYLGKAGIVSAFKYAHQADQAAKLFINDYNLEASRAKTDSLVALVTYLKTQGAQVDGIGTQMHCSLSTSYTDIDYMFQQLAATGLQVRISELDVTINPSPTDATVGDPIMLGYQAAMYKYIVDSYLKNVPAAQRYGITIWGVDDPDSWRASQLPLLWDKNFAKKPAYSAVFQALKGQ
ncbi:MULTISPECIES: endo-1,4-beta-xylanase [Chitinophagaceae]